MKSFSFVVLLLLWCSFLPASANEIFYFCLFTNAAAAQADSIIGTYWDAGKSAWDQGSTFPGVKIVTSQALLNGIGTGVGFWVAIGKPARNAALDAKVTATGPCWNIVDEDALNAGQAALVQSFMTAAGHQSFHFSPVAHGWKFPGALAQ